jgi:putative ABC transport system substrate-binding protein
LPPLRKASLDANGRARGATISTLHDPARRRGDSVITRRSVLLAGGIALLVAHWLGRAQTAVTTHRVGILQIGSEAAGAHLGTAFKQGMLDLGWLEGKNVEYRFAYADGDVNRLDAVVGELIGQKVEVMVVEGSPATRAAQRATKTIPIVMTSVSNPVPSGFVASLAKPGGNITGIASQSEEVLGKLIGILHEVTPGARRIAILLNENNPIYSALWVAAQSACAALDLVALRVVASTPAQLAAAVEEIVRQRLHAVVVVRDGMYLNERAKLHALMQTTRLPVAYQFREHVVQGGLLSYASNLPASFRHAAKYVDRILKGAKPADLPVEQAIKFELVINLKTAKALGLTIPQSLLLRADEVIQ